MKDHVLRNGALLQLLWLTASLTDGCIAPLLQKGQLVPALLNRGMGAGSAWNKA